MNPFPHSRLYRFSSQKRKGEEEDDEWGLCMGIGSKKQRSFASEWDPFFPVTPDYHQAATFFLQWWLRMHGIESERKVLGNCQIL